MIIIITFIVLFLIKFSLSYQSPILIPERTRDMEMTDIYYKIASFNKSYLSHKNQTEFLSLIDGLVNHYDTCKAMENKSIGAWIYCILVAAFWIVAALAGIVLFLNSLVRNLHKIIHLYRREQNGHYDNKSDSTTERKNENDIYGMLPLRQAAT